VPATIRPIIVTSPPTPASSPAIRRMLRSIDVPDGNVVNLTQQL
jgi:hypothetical protein